MFDTGGVDFLSISYRGWTGAARREFFVFLSKATLGDIVIWLMNNQLLIQTRTVGPRGDTLDRMVSKDVWCEL